jgi:gluconate 2-dehydrogenase gamma chain
MPSGATRREWALGAIGLASAPELAAAWQHAHQSANTPPPAKLEYLDAESAAEIESVTSEIIPSDGSPGAREAGVIYFIDRALNTWEAEKREAYRAGLEALQSVRRKMYPESKSLAALSSEERRRLITSVDQTPFFALLREHTVLGFYGSPSYGGNRGEVGWAQIGMEDKMVFEPPFGYYDAEAMKGRQR